MRGFIRSRRLNSGKLTMQIHDIGTVVMGLRHVLSTTEDVFCFYAMRVELCDSLQSLCTPV